MIVQVSVVLNRTVVVTVNNNSSILDYVYLDDHTLNSSYLWNDSWVYTFHSLFINTLFKSLVDVKKKKIHLNTVLFTLLSISSIHLSRNFNVRSTDLRILLSVCLEAGIVSQRHSAILGLNVWRKVRKRLTSTWQWKTSLHQRNLTSYIINFNTINDSLKKIIRFSLISSSWHNEHLCGKKLKK